jgi:hypothetical protein
MCQSTPKEVQLNIDRPRRWLALAALTLSVLIVGLDGTVINVALPTMAAQLHASSTQLQWIGGGYLLALSVAMLPVGLLGDRFGHKRLLLCGIGLFGLASLGGRSPRPPGGPSPPGPSSISAPPRSCRCRWRSCPASSPRPNCRRRSPCGLRRPRSA